MTEYVVFIRYRNEYVVAFTNAMGPAEAVQLVVERMSVQDHRDITERRVIPVAEMTVGAPTYGILT